MIEHHLIGNVMHWLSIYFYTNLAMVLVIAANCYVIKKWLKTRAKTKSILREIDELTRVR